MTLVLPMILGLELHRWHVAERLKQPPMVEPVDPLQRREFDVFQAFPRPTSADDFGLEQPDHGLGQGVIIGVADTAHGRLDPGFPKPLRVANGQVLASPVAVMDQAIESVAGSCV